jgi:glycosyltransferase involved in cell wall biosynthesis
MPSSPKAVGATWTTLMLTVSFVTLGSPSQLTGGYLYHRRMADAAPAHDVDFRFVSIPDVAFPLPALRGPAVLRRARAGDVVLMDSIATAFLAPALRRAPLSVPLVAVAHQTFGGIDHGPLRTRLQAGLDRSVYRRADRVIAASEALAGELVAGGLDGALVDVVPPGCDPGAPELPLPDLRGGRSAAFLAVGNWVERKGIIELLEAFSALAPDAATLHLVGREDVERRYAARVRDRLRRPDLSGRVVVHGPVPRARVATFLAAADAFVLPSIREPYGTVYGEALAMGVPVAGWRAGNLPHLVEDGKEGILVTPGDVAGLAAALDRLASDQGLRDRLRKGAEARGQALATWAESADRFFRIVRDVAERRGDGRG